MFEIMGGLNILKVIYVYIQCAYVLSFNDSSFVF